MGDLFFMSLGITLLIIPIIMIVSFVHYKRKGIKEKNNIKNKKYHSNIHLYEFDDIDNLYYNEETSNYEMSEEPAIHKIVQKQKKDSFKLIMDLEDKNLHVPIDLKNVKKVDFSNKILWK